MATLLFLTVYNFFRNFGERGYATKLEEMLEKASEAAHTAKKAKTMRSVSWKETLVGSLKQRRR